MQSKFNVGDMVEIIKNTCLIKVSEDDSIVNSAGVVVIEYTGTTVTSHAGTEYEVEGYHMNDIEVLGLILVNENGKYVTTIEILNNFDKYIKVK